MSDKAPLVKKDDETRAIQKQVPLPPRPFLPVTVTRDLAPDLRNTADGRGTGLHEIALERSHLLEIGRG